MGDDMAVLNWFETGCKAAALAMSRTAVRNG